MMGKITLKPIKFLDLTPSPTLRHELDAAYERVMSSGRYIGGYEVEAFEKEWAEYCQVDHCVACGNGFDALQLILRAYGVGREDEVLVPEWTAPPTWAAVGAVGGRPIPIDAMQPSFYNYKMAIIVPLYGIPTTIDKRVLAASNVIAIDAAQAHGAIYHGRRVGSIEKTSAWSFYPTKNLGAYGDGGAITCYDEKMARVIWELRSYGCPGAINSRMDPLQAAFLRVKLPYLDGWNARRREIAARYLAGLRDVPEICLPNVPDGCEPVWHQFVIQSPRRDHLRAFLLARGIETMIHYPVPPHRALGYDYDLPEADRLAREVLSLPVGPHLQDEEIGRVIETIKEWADGQNE